MTETNRQDTRLVDFICAAENNPGDLDTRLALAAALHENGRTARALEELAAMSERFPGAPAIFQARGNLLFGAGEWAAAIKQYHRAIESGGRTCEVYHNLGMANLAAGETEDARHSFSAALTLNPESLDSLLCLASVLYEEAQYAEVVEILEMRRDDHSDNPRLLHLLAASCLKTGDHLKAGVFVEEGLTRSPDDINLLLLKAEIFIQTGEFRRACDEYDRLIKKYGPHPIFLCNRGLTREMSGSRREALKDYDAALKTDPANVIALKNRGMLHAGSGALGRAIDDFSAALEKSPRDTVLLHNIAVAYLKKGDYKKATAALKKSCKLKHQPSCELLTKISAR